MHYINSIPNSNWFYSLLIYDFWNVLNLFLFIFLFLALKKKMVIFWKLHSIIIIITWDQTGHPEKSPRTTKLIRVPRGLRLISSKIRKRIPKKIVIKIFKTATLVLLVVLRLRIPEVWYIVVITILYIASILYIILLSALNWSYYPRPLTSYPSGLKF